MQGESISTSHVCDTPREPFWKNVFKIKEMWAEDERKIFMVF